MNVNFHGPRRVDTWRAAGAPLQANARGGAKRRPRGNSAANADSALRSALCRSPVPRRGGGAKRRHDTISKSFSLSGPEAHS